MMEYPSNEKPTNNPSLKTKGCGGCALKFFGCVALIAALLGWKALYFFTDMEPYQQAYVQLTGNAEAMRLLGAPVSTERGEGHYDWNSGDSIFTFTYEAKGSAKTGELSIDAYKKNGLWIYKTIHITVAGRTVDLMPTTEKHQPLVPLSTRVEPIIPSP